MARHKTLDMTMSRYTHTLTGDLIGAIDVLAAPPGDGGDGGDDATATESVALPATGTDDAAIADAAAELAPMLAPESDFSCLSMASDDATDTDSASTDEARKPEDLTALDGDCHTMRTVAGVAELADATDSKSVPGHTGCGFESLHRHDCLGSQRVARRRYP